VKNESKGEPVAGVSVKAEGANPAVSLDRGNFALEFPRKSPGDLVTLRVEKAGLVVVNWVQLKATLPGHPNENESEILLAEERNREEMARRFFRLRGIETIEAAYRRQLQEKGADIALLRGQRAEAEAALVRTAEELAKLKPGQTSQLYEEAMRLVAAGKTTEAIVTLPEARLKQLTYDAHERKRQALEEIEQATAAWLLRADLLTTNLEFVEAGRAYQEAVDNTPEDIHAIFRYASFSQSLNHNQVAKAQYDRCLALARAKGDPVAVATALNNLGVLYRDQNKLEESGKALEESLTIRRQLASTKPDVYLPDVAMTLNNLAVLHSDLHRTDEARKAYEESLRIRRQMARTKPDAYLPDVASSLNNLATMNRDQDRLEEASKAYEEAITIRRQLAHSNPHTYLPDLAGTLNNLGVLLSDQELLEEASKAYEEALTIRRRLAETNPDTYLLDVAATLHNLGILHAGEQRVNEARKAYEEALSIRRELARADPDAYLPDVAETLGMLGELEAADEHLLLARKDLEEALEILTPFKTRVPSKYAVKFFLIREMLGELPH
jgi:tetratricopeptide (TPR) repeat protein